MADNNIEKLLAWAISQLKSMPQSTDSPALDARLLLAHCLAETTTYLMTWPEKQVSEENIEAFKKLVFLRKEGRPIAHLVGQKDFWSLSLHVNTHTLIPRPETELLVEKALQLSLPETAKVLDLGTGTGAIAIALAAERKNWHLTGVDRIEQALVLARENAQYNAINNVRFTRSNWFEDIPPQTYDLIVSNPPYVESNSPFLSQGDVRFEPLSALTAGEDGMQDIKQIIPNALSYLKTGAWLLIEHGFNQANAVGACFHEHGYINVELVRDLNQLPRLTLAQKTG
ncbi:MAG: peptide chain release factor N(5)-glutamine methyltransferase [Aliiglaciecola sp.]